VTLGAKGGEPTPGKSDPVLLRGKSSGAGERPYFGKPPPGKASVASNLNGSHDPPSIGCPSGQRRAIRDLPAATDGNAAGAILAFRIGGSGEHNNAFAEHTEANVHDGASSRLIRMPPPSRVTFAVWPRVRSWVH
jgi:hypothetical protein